MQSFSLSFILDLERLPLRMIFQEKLCLREVGILCCTVRCCVFLWGSTQRARSLDDER